MSDISDPERGVIRGSIHDLPWTGHCNQTRQCWISERQGRFRLHRHLELNIQTHFFVCPLLLLSIFLHPKKTIFVKSVRVLLFPCISSYWWVHFPGSVLVWTSKHVNSWVFGVNPFVKVIKLQLAVINKNVFIRLQLGCVRYLECLEFFPHVSSKRSEHSTHPNCNWIRIFCHRLTGVPSL